MNKAQVLEGMSCRKRLWWSTYEPGEELDKTEVVQDLLSEGQAVGARAREAFPGFEPEVPFEGDGVSIRTDLIDRSAGTVRLYEVKASNSIRDPRLVDDVAIQVHVLRAAGATVEKAHLVHLNTACKAPDLSNLFVVAEVTAEVEKRLPAIAEAIQTARTTIEGSLPTVDIGAHCRRGKDDACPFIDRCWKEVPKHHVSELYYIGGRWEEFAKAGHRTIDRLPDGVKLPKKETARQVRAIKEDRRIVEPGLGAALEAWRGPVACLDFETTSSAIPRYAGCTPWEQMPVQFSVDYEVARSLPRRHFAWIAEDSADPRPALAKALVEACRDAETIVAWYASFEKACLKHLQNAVPALARELLDIEERLVDALPVVRDHIYDPEFRGGFSIKKVQPALVRELPGYDTFEIQEGMTASVRLKKLMRGEPSLPADRERIRRDLLEYCNFDTFGLRELIGKLREIAAAPTP